MIESRDAAVALGTRRENRERSWRLPSGRGYLYPAFQFDAARRDVATEVRTVNELLDASGDPWGVASWCISRNDRLAARPRDLVGTKRACELAAAARPDGAARLGNAALPLRSFCACLCPRCGRVSHRLTTTTPAVAPQAGLCTVGRALRLRLAAGAGGWRA